MTYIDNINNLIANLTHDLHNIESKIAELEKVEDNLHGKELTANLREQSAYLHTATAYEKLICDLEEMLDRYEN